MKPAANLSWKRLMPQIRDEERQNPKLELKRRFSGPVP